MPDPLRSSFTECAELFQVSRWCICLHLPCYASTFKQRILFTLGWLARACSHLTDFANDPRVYPTELSETYATDFFCHAVQQSSFLFPTISSLSVTSLSISTLFVWWRAQIKSTTSYIVRTIGFPLSISHAMWSHRDFRGIMTRLGQRQPFTGSFNSPPHVLMLWNYADGKQLASWIRQ